MMAEEDSENMNYSAHLSQPAQHGSRWNKTERAAQGILCAALVTLIGTAAWLTPDPSGLGTHQQLGLPGCSFYTWLGIRCPGCGMTTSWAHTLDGDIESGLKSNIAGVALLLLTLSTIPCLAFAALTGRRSQNHWLIRVSVIALCSIGLIALGEWAIRLAVAWRV